MDVDLAALPDDVDALHRLIRDLAADRAGERTALSEAQAEIERLWLIVQKLQRLQFGRRAERLDGDQLELGLEDLDADIARAEELLPAARAKEPVTRTRLDRPSLPDHLEREDVHLAFDAEACPCCGGALHAIGETVSEMLDWVPARLRVIRIRRPRYGCRACGTIHQAPAPERPIAKGLASPGLLAHVLISKYCDHVPLYRQSPGSMPGTINPGAGPSRRRQFTSTVLTAGPNGRPVISLGSRVCCRSTAMPGSSS